MRYKVMFTQYSSYEVDADTQEDAEKIAFCRFINDPYRISCPGDYDCIDTQILYYDEEDR